MKQILIKNIGAKDYALFYQELSNVVGEYCYSFEIDDEFESQVDVKIAKVIKQMKEWEQGAIKMDSFAGCSDAMAFTYKLCYELLESNFSD